MHPPLALTRLVLQRKPPSWSLCTVHRATAEKFEVPEGEHSNARLQALVVEVRAFAEHIGVAQAGSWRPSHSLLFRSRMPSLLPSHWRLDTKSLKIETPPVPTTPLALEHEPAHGVQSATQVSQGDLGATILYGFEKGIFVGVTTLESSRTGLLAFYQAHHGSSWDTGLLTFICPGSCELRMGTQGGKGSKPTTDQKGGHL